MATRRCLRDPTHSSVWRCPCASGGDFCSLCILDHLGTTELTHCPAPIDPPVGQKVCGRCHGQPPESIRFNYELCLCSACAGEMRISRVAGEALPPGFGAEAGEAVFPPEENRPQAPRSVLRAVLGEKKSDIQNTLRRLFDNMNSFEDIIAQAFEFEGKLAESQAEVLRLKNRLAEALGARADNMGVQSMLERLEAVSRENGELRNANSNYAAEVRDLKEKLNSRPERSAGEPELSETMQLQLQMTIETLKGIVDAKNLEIADMLRARVEPLELRVAEKDEVIARLKSEMDSFKGTAFAGFQTEISNLKDDIVRQTTEATKTAVIKVSEVMPLLNCLEDLHSETDQTVKMMREMAVLGAEDKLEEDLVKKAASTFSPLIKLVGPSKTAEEFIQLMTKRLSDKREIGCREMHWTREIYDIVKGEVKAKDALLEFMKLLKKEESFESMVELVKQLMGLADAQSICELLIGTSEYFADPPKNDPWKDALLNIRKDWGSEEAAKRGVSAFIRCAGRAHLNASYLQLLPLLNCDQGVQVPSHLLVERLSESLLNQAVSDKLEPLITRITDYSSSISKKQISMEQAATVLTTIERLLIGEAAEVDQVIAMVDMMVQDETVATKLLQLLSSNAQVGPTVVAWTMQEGQSNLQFALELLQEDHANKSAKAAEFLEFIADNPQLPLVETAKSLHQKLGKDIFGLLLALKTEDLNNVLHILDQLTSAREWIVQTTALLAVSAQLALRVYAVYSDLVRRGAQSPTEGALGKDMMEAFKTMDKLDDSFALLEAVSNTLKVDGVQYAQIGHIIKYWQLFRRTLPGNPFVNTLAIQLLGILREKSQEIGKLLDLLSISEKTSSHSPLVLLLAKVYLDNRQSILRNSSKFPEEVVRALKIMKELNPAQRADLEQLTQKATGTLSLGAALPFLEGAYTQCSESTNLLKLLDNHTLLLEEMSRLKVPGHYQKLLRLARPDTASGVSRLTALIVYLETLEIAQIDLPQWPNPLFIQSPPFGNFLTSVESMVKKHSELCRVGYLLLQSIPPAFDQVMLFVPQMASDLMDAGARPEFIAAFCNMALRDADIRSVMETLRAQWKLAVISELALVLNTTQSRVTKSDVESVCSAQIRLSAQGKLLARVQAGDVRLFDFNNRTWGPSMPVTPQIHRGDHCEWTFLDSTQLFVCGGTRQAGEYAPSRRGGSRFRVTYLLVYGSPNWTSTQLLDMITARRSHGILYLAQFNSVFVFGGSSGGSARQVVHASQQAVRFIQHSSNVRSSTSHNSVGWLYQTWRKVETGSIRASSTM